VNNDGLADVIVAAVDRVVGLPSGCRRHVQR
jgi:hypothetical protein